MSTEDFTNINPLEDTEGTEDVMIQKPDAPTTLSKVVNEDIPHSITEVENAKQTGDMASARSHAVHTHRMVEANVTRLAELAVLSGIKDIPENLRLTGERALALKQKGLPDSAGVPSEEEVTGPRAIAREAALNNTSLKLANVLQRHKVGKTSVYEDLELERAQLLAKSKGGKFYDYGRTGAEDRFNFGAKWQNFFGTEYAGGADTSGMAAHLSNTVSTGYDLGMSDAVRHEAVAEIHSLVSSLTDDPSLRQSYYGAVNNAVKNARASGQEIKDESGEVVSRTGFTQHATDGAALDILRHIRGAVPKDIPPKKLSNTLFTALTRYANYRERDIRDGLSGQLGASHVSVLAELAAADSLPRTQGRPELSPAASAYNRAMNLGASVRADRLAKSGGDSITSRVVTSAVNGPLAAVREYIVANPSESMPEGFDEADFIFKVSQMRSDAELRDTGAPEALITLAKDFRDGYIYDDTRAIAETLQMPEAEAFLLATSAATGVSTSDLIWSQRLGEVVEKADILGLLSDAPAPGSGIPESLRPSETEVSEPGLDLPGDMVPKMADLELPDVPLPTPDEPAPSTKYTPTQVSGALNSITTILDKLPSPAPGTQGARDAELVWEKLNNAKAEINRYTEPVTASQAFVRDVLAPRLKERLQNNPEFTKLWVGYEGAPPAVQKQIIARRDALVEEAMDAVAGSTDEQGNALLPKWYTTKNIVVPDADLSPSLEQKTFDKDLSDRIDIAELFGEVVADVSTEEGGDGVGKKKTIAPPDAFNLDLLDAMHARPGLAKWLKRSPDTRTKLVAPQEVVDRAADTARELLSDLQVSAAKRQIAGNRLLFGGGLTPQQIKERRDLMTRAQAKYDAKMRGANLETIKNKASVAGAKAVKMAQEEGRSGETTLINDLVDDIDKARTPHEAAVLAVRVDDMIDRLRINRKANEAGAVARAKAAATPPKKTTKGKAEAPAKPDDTDSK